MFAGHFCFLTAKRIEVRDRKANCGEQLFRTLICNFTTHSYVADMDTRERISELVENPEQVQELAQAVQEQGKELLNTADDWIRRNPYLAMGVALAVGCAIAACLRNRD